MFLFNGYCVYDNFMSCKQINQCKIFRSVKLDIKAKYELREVHRQH